MRFPSNLNVNLRHDSVRKKTPSESRPSTSGEPDDTCCAAMADASRNTHESDFDQPASWEPVPSIPIVNLRHVRPVQKTSVRRMGRRSRSGGRAALFPVSILFPRKRPPAAPLPGRRSRAPSGFYPFSIWFYAHARSPTRAPFRFLSVFSPFKRKTDPRPWLVLRLRTSTPRAGSHHDTPGGSSGKASQGHVWVRPRLG